ncbi:MAG: hypothetical protein JNJ90_10400 [Saprospiraceae bacterium]|nr:hypothetical protein [Saprospiraceae bacterium]
MKFFTKKDSKSPILSDEINFYCTKRIREKPKRIPASNQRTEPWEYVGKEMAAAGFYTDSGHSYFAISAAVGVPPTATVELHVQRWHQSPYVLLASRQQRPKS